MKRRHPDCACCGKSTRGLRTIAHPKLGGPICVSCVIMLDPHWRTQDGREFTRGRDPIAYLEGRI